MTLETTTDSIVHIPCAFVELLNFDETQALIAALHDGPTGADETTNYGGIDARYCATDSTTARLKAQTVLESRYPQTIATLEAIGGPAYAELCRAIGRTSRKPETLESVIRGVLRVDDDGPHIGDAADLLYMIQRGKHHTESQALEAAQGVASELRDIADALEAAR